MRGKLYVVATPIGNLKDISENALFVLKEAHLIAAEDTRTTMNLLRHFNIKTKLTSYHKFNENKKSENLIDHLMKGEVVCLVSDAGTPCISDPGSILIREAIDNNIEVIGIPGPSAVITGLSVSGFDIPSFSFYGFLPREKNKIKKALNDIKDDNTKIAVLYESPKRIISTMKEIKEVLDNPKVCICNDLTKKFEKKYYGFSEEVIDSLNNNQNSDLGEYVIIIEKKPKEKEQNKEVLSVEADLIDTMIKNKCSMKEAIKIVSRNRKTISTKDEIYKASLVTKNMFIIKED